MAILDIGKAIKDTIEDASKQRSRITCSGIVRERRSCGDSIREDANLHIGLDNCHLDIERSDFVGDTLHVLLKS